MFDWFKTANLENINTMKEYHVMHDCGKPLCIEIDENGKRHFPNHAEVSYQQYKTLYPDNYIIQELIRLDMGFHTFKDDELVQLWKHELADSLYLTAWAEIMSNAEMFGGIESTSFKIKRKRLIKALKQKVN